MPEANESVDKSSNSMNRLGIEFLSVFGLPPVPFVELASGLGCRYISICPEPLDYNPHGYPKYSLLQDRALRRDLIAALRDHGVSISLGEGFVVRPESDVAALDPIFDLMREIGVRRINALSFDHDLSRTFDQLGKLADMAAAAEMEEVVLEFVPGFGVADLATAMAAIRHVHRRDFRLLIDTLRFFRSGARVASLAALDPDIIGYVQLSDGLLDGKIPDYRRGSPHQRLAPGSGEFPLLELLKVVPRDRIMGLEVPLRAEAEAGMGPHDRVRRCIDGAVPLLTRLGGMRQPRRAGEARGR